MRLSGISDALLLGSTPTLTITCARPPSYINTPLTSPGALKSQPIRFSTGGPSSSPRTLTPFTRLFARTLPLPHVSFETPWQAEPPSSTHLGPNTQH